MYYIKQKLGLKKFVVHNTDDNTDEVLSWDEVETAVRQLHIPIEGVYTRSWHGGSAGPLVVYRVEVYVPPAQRTGKEAKLKAISGVDVETNNGYINSVTWQTSRDNKMRVIHLSDYGRTLGVGLFDGVAESVLDKLGQSYLTIVLDDNLEVLPKTFRKLGDLYNYNHLDVLFDLREVTKQSIISAFYKEFLDGSSLIKHWKYVIDGQERKDLWAGVKILNEGLPYDGAKKCNVHSFISDVATAKANLLAMFEREFASLSKKYKFPGADNWARSANMLGYLVWIRSDGRRYLSEPDFDVVWKVYNNRQSCYSLPQDVVDLRFIIDASAPKAVQRLDCYIKVFGADVKVQKYFIGFYRRANAALLEWADSKGI